MSKAVRELSGASNLKDEGVGHYLATRALSCPLARRKFKHAVQYVNSATSTHTTGEACKAAVEAYAASLLPPTAMCELVLNMRAPKSSWRTLSELYTLRKLEYHRTVPGGPYSRPICTERAFQARWKELVAPVQLDDPVARVLPKATGVSWPFASVPAAHWWLSGNVKLGLIWGSVVHCDVFVLVCCAFCMLGNVHLMFLEVLDTHLFKVQGGGYFFWRRLS